jgi:hypothetical protein
VGQKPVHRRHHIRPHCQLIPAAQRHPQRCTGSRRLTSLHVAPHRRCQRRDRAPAVSCRGCCAPFACGHTVCHCLWCPSAGAQVIVGITCSHRQGPSRSGVVMLIVSRCRTVAAAGPELDASRGRTACIFVVGLATLLFAGCHKGKRWQRRNVRPAGYKRCCW